MKKSIAGIIALLSTYLIYLQGTDVYKSSVFSSMSLDSGLALIIFMALFYASIMFLVFYKDNKNG